MLRALVDNSVFSHLKRLPRALGPVHTYPDIFESATFSFRIRLSSTRIRRIRMRIHNFLNPLSRVEIFESANSLEPCERANPDIFESDDVAKSAGSSLYQYKQGPRSNFEIGGGGGTISDSILGGGAQDTFSH